ncbi:hypothetical protein BGX34_011867 [Mortierella sp. NVP85]|nr:hypothetical protein BGX34_011867 [Mortierella sp. NVP85]
MESGGSGITPSTTGRSSSQSLSPEGIAEHQSFRSHDTVVRIRVKHNQPLGVKYVYWSDLTSCFPGIARVQHGDVVLTFMRGEDELRMKPFRIEYIPGAILDIIFTRPQHHAHPVVHTRESRRNLFLHTSQPTGPPDPSVSHEKAPSSGENDRSTVCSDGSPTDNSYQMAISTNSDCSERVALRKGMKKTFTKSPETTSTDDSEAAITQGSETTIASHTIDLDSTLVLETCIAEAVEEVLVKQVPEALAATKPSRSSIPQWGQQQRRVQEQQQQQKQQQGQEQEGFQRHHQQQRQDRQQKKQRREYSEEGQQQQEQQEQLQAQVQVQGRLRQPRQQQGDKQRKSQHQGDYRSVTIEQPSKPVASTSSLETNPVNGHPAAIDSMIENGPMASGRGSKANDCKGNITATLLASDSAKCSRSTGRVDVRIPGPSNQKKSSTFGHAAVVTGDCDSIQSKLAENTIARPRGISRVQDIKTLEQIMALAELHGEFDPKPWIGFDESSKAEILQLKRDVMNCVQLLNSYMKSSAGDEILQAERFGLALERVLKDMNSRGIQDHVLLEQIDLLQQGAAVTKDVVSKLRPLLLQIKANHITGTHYGVFEHMEQKMFVILPEGDTFKDGFRLHFLCECCQLTRMDLELSTNWHQDDETLKKNRVGLPHQLHLTKHEGYKLRYTEEFVARYGNHMWILLHMLQDGYEDQGVSVPPMEEGSVLRKKIALAIAYIESEPDPGEREGSWDFSQVSEFYVAVGVSNEGSVGSLCRIITSDGYAKWVCYEHYRERFPENDYKILQNTLNTFFYNEALGAVLVSLSSRREAYEFYKAIVKAVNLQELGMELAWEVNEQDIKEIQAVLPCTTAVSIKIFVPFEHHVALKTADVTTKEDRGLDITNPDYALGHYKTNLIKQIVNDRRIQAFYLDIIDRPDYPDYHDSLHLTLRNTSSYESWNPNRTALCDVVRTVGPLAKTKLSFSSPTLERGFYFMNTAIQSEIRFETAMATVNFREQICIIAGEEKACRCVRIQYWSNDAFAFTQNLQRLWLDVRTPQETQVLQQLIELNPHLEKLRVTTGTSMFYKIYEVVQRTVVASGHNVPMKLTLKDERNTSLTWSELVVPPERKKDQIISLDYSAGATNISAVLMFFGYMITHLTSLEFTDLDVKTLEACTRSRGSNITSLDVNILGLSRNGLEDLGKLVDRSAESMSQQSSRISIHLSVMDGVRPDWTRVTTFVLGMGPKIDELVLYSRQIGESGVETFFERVTPEALPFLSVLIVRGSIGALPGLSKGSITTLSAAISSAMSVAALASTPNGNKSLAPPGLSTAPAPTSAAITTPSPLATLESELINVANQTTSSQFSSKFLPWLESIISRLPLQKVGLNYVLLETEEWRSVLSKINFTELQCLDLKGSKMTMGMFYELPSHLPTYDRFLTSVSPIATYETIKRRKERTRSRRPFDISEVSAKAPVVLEDEMNNGGPNGAPRAKMGSPTTRRRGKPMRQATSVATSKERKASAAEEKEAAAKVASDAAQLSVRRWASKANGKSRKPSDVQDDHEKRQVCSVYRITLPSTSDYRLERYQKVMIQNEIRTQLIGCEVD